MIWPRWLLPTWPQSMLFVVCDSLSQSWAALSDLRAASSELTELIRLCGLAGVLPLVDQGQTEQREEPVGVEEEVEPGDTAL